MEDDLGFESELEEVEEALAGSDFLEDESEGLSVDVLLSLLDEESDESPEVGAAVAPPFLP
ncbi:MAG: hypothetical protein O2854_03130 [Chloroflexi bacterium]|nr:hypothetical protein [Chloroflexota bacterium]